MKGLIYILAISIYFPVRAQVTNENAKEYLLNSYSSMQEKVNKCKQQKQSGLHLVYLVNTTVKAKEEDFETNDKIEVFSNYFVNSLISKSLSVYSDSANTYAVFPNKKTILITKSSPESFNQNSNQKIEILKDTLIKVGNIEEVVTNNGIVKITLSVPSQYTTTYPIKKIIYSVLESTGEIKEVQVEYNELSKYKWMTVDFKLIDYNYTGSQLKNTASGYIFNLNGKLNATYTEYNLIDKR